MNFNGGAALLYTKFECPFQYDSLVICDFVFSGMCVLLMGSDLFVF